LTEPTKSRRSRRGVASDEAHAWARSLPLNNPNGKTVLRALALYVNGEGCCFVGIDQLAEDTDLSADTVRRRLVWLEQVGAIVRLPQWLDGNGRRNGDGKGKRTSDEIRLLLDADIDEIEKRALGDVGANSPAETTDFSPSSQQGLNEEAETVSPRLAVGQPSQSCEGLISEPEPEISPQPPSGGSVDLEGWKEFEGDWAEPILRQSIAQQVWAALKPEERNLARQAARGYVAWRKAQRKPPNVLGAHLFLKERDAWAEFAKRDPGSARSNVTGVPVDSDEGKAVVAMYAVARSRPFESQGRIVYPGEITPQILVLATAGRSSSWPWIEDRQQIGAWSNFLNAHVRGSRGPLVVTRGIGADQRSGIYAPWPWPPRKDGTLSPTGPPETLMSEQDLVDFK
jgi:DNA-binding transcriptional ArsR family regulator